MPTGQQYATNVPQTQLPGGVTAGATSGSVSSSASWPSTPFTAVFSLGDADQEAVDVTAVVGTTWTWTRGIDGTVAVAHSPGTTVTHCDIGRDFREARSHIDAIGGNDASGHAVHGLTGNVVGTSDSQTLTNKSLTSPTLTGTVAGSPTFSGSPTFGGGLVVGGGSAIDLNAASSTQPIVGPAPAQYAGGQPWGGTGFALGNGSAAANYVEYGRQVFFSAKLVLGTTTNLGSNVLTLTLPKQSIGAVAFGGTYFRQVADDRGLSATSDISGTIVNVTTLNTATVSYQSLAQGFYAFQAGDTVIFNGTYAATS